MRILPYLPDERITPFKLSHGCGVPVPPPTPPPLPHPATCFVLLMSALLRLLSTYIRDTAID